MLISEIEQVHGLQWPLLSNVGTAEEHATTMSEIYSHLAQIQDEYHLFIKWAVYSSPEYSILYSKPTFMQY